MYPILGLNSVWVMIITSPYRLEGLRAEGIRALLPYLESRGKEMITFIRVPSFQGKRALVKR